MVVAIAMVVSASAFGSNDARAREAFGKAQAAIDGRRGEEALRHLERTEQLLGGINTRIVVARVQALGLLGRHRELLAAVAAYRALGPQPSLAVHAQLFELERKASSAEQAAAKVLVAIEQRHAKLVGAQLRDRHAKLGDLLVRLDELTRTQPHVTAATRARELRQRWFAEHCLVEYELLEDRARTALADYQASAQASSLVVAYGAPAKRGCKSASSAADQVAALTRHAGIVAELHRLRSMARIAAKSYEKPVREASDLRAKIADQQAYRDALARTTIRSEIRRAHLPGPDRAEVERRIRELEQQLAVVVENDRIARRRAAEREADHADRIASRYRRRAILVGTGALVGLAGGITIMAAQPFDNKALDLSVGGVVGAVGLGLLFAFPRNVNTAKESARRARERRRAARRIVLQWSPVDPHVIAIGGAW